MNNYEEVKEKIITQYGNIKRARGCYLYTSKGVRLIDMYQEEGRAILGWGNVNNKSMQVMKNTIDRGMTGSFPSDYEYQLKRALLQIFPEYSHVRWYNSRHSLGFALSSYLNFQGTLDSESNTTEQFSDDSWLYKQGVLFWRPWLTDDWSSAIKSHLKLKENHEITSDVVVICPPISWANAGYFVIYKDNNLGTIISSDFYPSAFIAAVTRSFYDLVQVLKTRGEEQWKVFDGSLSPYFHRYGPYLITKVPEEKYKDFFLHCLNSGIVLAPSFYVPSIVPYGVSPGNFRELDRNPFIF